MIGARVSFVNTHETKTKALEAKCVEAAKAKEKHKEALADLISQEKQRHTNALNAIQENFEMFQKKEDGIIKEAEEALRALKVECELANGKINGYISKHLPAETKITPETLNHEAIADHILMDENIKGLMNFEGEGVVQSLCNLLNVIAANRKSETEESSESEMDLDEKEEPVPVSMRKPCRRRSRKPPGGAVDEEMKQNGGKSEADNADLRDQPAKFIATDPVTAQAAAAAEAAAAKAAEEAALATAAGTKVPT